MEITCAGAAVPGRRRRVGCRLRAGESHCSILRMDSFFRGGTAALEVRAGMIVRLTGQWAGCRIGRAYFRQWRGRQRRFHVVDSDRRRARWALVGQAGVALAAGCDQGNCGNHDGNRNSHWKLLIDGPMLENDPGWRERGGACIECRHQVGKLSFPPIVRLVPDRFGALTHKTRTGPVALRPKHKRSDAGCASAHWRAVCAGEQRRRRGVDILAVRPRPVSEILRTTDMRPAIATDLQGGRCMTTRPCAMRRMGSRRDVRRSGACGLQAGMR